MEQNQTPRVVRRAYRFTGWVQGVGFRWRARTAADALGVTGCVENDSDGSVYLEAQGTPAALDSLLAALYRGPYIQIDRVETRPLPLVNGERGFAVRG